MHRSQTTALKITIDTARMLFTERAGRVASVLLVVASAKLSISILMVLVSFVPKKSPTMKRSDNLFEDIFHVARQVPHGSVTTYGAIAEYLQFGSPRIVGIAMHQSFMAQPPVPAHRVVNRNGDLTGRNHFRTPTMMQELLESEGVKVENDRVQDFKKLVWYPADHLD